MKLDNILKQLEERAIGYTSGNAQVGDDFLVKFKRVWETIRTVDFENSIIDFHSSSNRNKEDSESDMSSEMAYLRTFELSNWVIDLDNTKYVGDGTKRVSDIWSNIIEAAEVAELDDNTNDERRGKYLEELKTVDKKAIYDAENHLIKAEEEFDEKLNEIVFNGGARGPEIWGDRGKIYKRRVDRAKDDLEIAAYKYNDLTAKLNALGQDPSAFAINRAEDRLEDYSDQLGNKDALPLTYMSPSNWYDPKADGWKKISDVKTNESIKGISKKNNVGLGFGINLGFWKIGPKVQVENEKQEINKISDNFTVECEYLIPRVQRPWMDTNLLKANNWYIKSRKKYCISDGNPIQDKADKSEMFLPAIVTGLILVKNVRIKWEKNTEETENLKREIGIGGSLGYGLMQMVGKYKHEKQERDQEIKVDENSITIKGIQLIGYVCKVLAGSPQLDSKVTESNE